MGLLRWIEEQRQWRREHTVAFAEASALQSDGLTLFQHRAIAAVATLVPLERFTRIAMDSEPGVYLLAPIGVNGAELYIYPNDAAIFGAKPYAWFEEWDFRTPAELIEVLAKECARRAA